MNYRIVFSPEAEELLAELYIYLSDAASPDIAFEYTEAIVKYCERLHTFPIRGTTRDDVRLGLRISNYKKRVVIALEREPVLCLFPLAGVTPASSARSTRKVPAPAGPGRLRPARPRSWPARIARTCR